MGTFVFKWEHPANEVYVTGTFDDWKKSEKLVKNGDVFEKKVTLSTIDQKILYKFVVDGNWTTSHTHPTEADEHGNTNNLLLPSEITPLASTSAISSAAPTSTTAAMAGQVPLEGKATPGHEGLPGAFPETPAAEPSDFSVNPIPESKGPGNPIQLAPGDKVPGFNSADVTKGVHDDPELKEKDQTFGVAPLPATGGIGNPVNLAPGQKVPPSGEVTGNTITSNVTLDKESYEKADGGVPQLPPVSGVSGTSKGGAFDVPPITGNLIPESSLPIGNGTIPDTKDPGVFTSSAAPTSTTAALAGQVPLEKSDVPKVVTESQKKAHVDPEASASPVAVEEKKEVEQELLSKVPTEPPAAGGNITDHAAAAAGVAGGALAATATAATAAALSAQEKVAETTSSATQQLPESVQQSINQLNSASGVTPSSTTAGLAGAVPKEPASGVPAVVSESISAAHTSPEAAANPEAVTEKKALEKELLSEVKLSNAAGEPAPAVSAALTDKAPAASTSNDGLAPHALLDNEPLKSSSEPKVDETAKSPPPVDAAKLNAKASESRDVSPFGTSTGPDTGASLPTTTTAEGETSPAKTGEPSTPAKKNGATPSEASGTPKSTDKKNKRRSRFIQKIKDFLH